MILLKNEPNRKSNHIIIVQISFFARNAIKFETKNVNKTISFIQFLEYFWSFDL